jgi:hypothetical protein
MHFRLPKPLHGWREFVGEVGIIVIGVLIALGAEQLVATLHWRSEVRETDQRLVREMAMNLSSAYERFAIDACLRPRLTELRDQLLASGTRWPGSRATLANDVYHSEFPSVYRTPDRPWSQTSWRTALSGDNLNHFDAQRVLEFSALHDDVDALDKTQAEETRASAMLGDLAFAGPISPADRRADLKSVVMLDSLDARMLYLARQLIDQARTAGINPDPQVSRDNLAQQRNYRGACVTAPPLNAL